MDALRYQQIRQLFDAAQAEPSPERREALLAEAPDLRAAVERLLEAAARGTGVFEQPSVVSLNSSASEPRWEGRRLGPYELLSELGEGGMGVVYLARRADGAFEKQVAIKIVRQNLATPEFLARFQREREILAKLEHPHIARLLDGGATPQGLAYLVMEYVKGESLLTYADSRRLTYDNRLRLLHQVAEAVDYAHQQGVIHRDLKPSNIFVGADGQVKLLDFGIAAWQSGASDVEAAAPTLALSPAYASPEQARGERTTKFSDIYSLAMVAYELLAGVLPFQLQGVTLPEVLMTVSERMPALASMAMQKSGSPSQIAIQRRMSPIALIGRLEQTADATLFRALSKRPQDRPSTACSLTGELQGPGARGPDGSWPKQALSIVQKNRSIAFGLLLFALLILVGDIVVKPFAWLTLAAFLLLFGLRRAYALRFRSEYTTAFVPIVLVAVQISWVATHKGPGRSWISSLTLPEVMLALGVSMGVLYLLRIRRFRRSELIVSSLDRSQVALMALMVAFVLYETSSGTENPVFPDRNTWLGWLSIGAACFTALIFAQPSQIRTTGIATHGRIATWKEIESYEWKDGSKLIFNITSLASGSLMITVPPLEAPRVQRELQRWLTEAAPAEMQRPDV